jgi:hypothetical protein
MAELEHHVFVLARPTGANAAKSCSPEALSRRSMETGWAVEHGIDINKVLQAGGTDTVESTDTVNTTTSGTQTDDGSDMTTDSSTETTSDDVPDITADN